jgi:hypothetical protein
VDALPPRFLLERLRPLEGRVTVLCRYLRQKLE